MNRFEKWAYKYLCDDTLSYNNNIYEYNKCKITGEDIVKYSGTEFMNEAFLSIGDIEEKFNTLFKFFEKDMIKTLKYLNLINDVNKATKEYKNYYIDFAYMYFSQYVLKKCHTIQKYWNIKVYFTEDILNDIKKEAKQIIENL